MMEQEKAATVDTIEQERRKLKRELRRGREKIEDAREAMSEAIADQKTMGFFRIVMAGLLSWTAVMGALWVEEATISPEWGVSLGGVLIVMLILMRWGLKEAMKEEAET
jgi:hypothetical protein